MIKRFSFGTVKGKTNLKIISEKYVMGIDPRSIFLSSIFVLSTISMSLYGQESGEYSPSGFRNAVLRAYGQDQELVNGMQYYNKHPHSMGHPYLYEGWAHEGSVSLRGKKYINLWLKYDIHAQQVVVEYLTMNGGDNQVILVSDRIDDFSIGEHYFRRMSLEAGQNDAEDPDQFYQVIGDERMLLYIGWHKKLVPVSGDSRFSEEFTTPKRDYFLQLDGSIFPFNSRKGFVRLFPKAIQKDMKRLIRINNLQMRSASTNQLELFIIAAANMIREADQ